MRAAFQERVGKAKTRLIDVAQEVCRVVSEILTEYQALRPRINQQGVPVWQRAMTDIRNQLKELLTAGLHRLDAAAAAETLPALPQGHPVAPGQVRRSTRPRTPNGSSRSQSWWQAYQGRVAAEPQRGVHDSGLDEFRWMLEELRVSLWAQQLKTPYPISFKRLEKFWSELR